ncbi:DNAJ domain-containing protein [Cryptosporidium canis]|uniref:DNAJ domain-containing protein n=1 Tax=Cryptosporidium canis TaxID=195482 RepID=A0ABQ8P672_9CRYT|nr:DNAJ domain-containing protein [Cryptosporidium canis]KAJ1615216.1 DNAJ domain-containing protein [Cryptosporidium canis]
MEQEQKNVSDGAFLPEIVSSDAVECDGPDERSKSEVNTEELPYDQRYSKIEPGSTSFDDSTSSWYQLALRSGTGNATGEDINSLFYTDDGVLGGLFSTRRPRDAMAGFSSGMKTVGKGVAAGVATLVAAPVVGAATEGVAGFFKGMGAGLVAAVALPVTAVGVAGYQMARGVANTPEAISESNKGRKWDKKNRQWIEYYYSLDDEVKQLNEKVAKSSQKNSDESDDYVKRESTDAPLKHVADTTYYDLLSVSPNASADEIRRQYYRKAKQYHPDKNPDDADAKEKFQKLGEAYQILADPERRKRYDEYGIGATYDMPVIDSSLIFTILFGSDSLEKYVGKLKMVSLVEIATNNGSQNGFNGSNEMEQAIDNEQSKRTILLAVEMRKKIAPVLNEFDAENSTPIETSEILNQWREEISQEAKSLCNNSFCDAMVEAIGWSYENYGSQYLGKIDTFLGIGGKYAKFQAKTRNVASTWKMASTAIKTAMAAQSLQSSMKKKQSSGDDERQDETNGDQSPEDSEKTQKQFEETLPLILDTMLQITIMDIEDTIRTVAKKLVKDMGVDLKVRKQRALALIELGSIFQSVANTSNQQREESGDKPDARRKVEEAFIKAAQQKDERQ